MPFRSFRAGGHEFIPTMTSGLPTTRGIMLFVDTRAFVSTNLRSPDNNLIETIEIRGEDTTARIQITDSLIHRFDFPPKQCIKAVEDEGSPFRLFLGKASVVYAKQRSQELYRDAVTWEDISNVVDYPEVPEENFKT